MDTIPVVDMQSPDYEGLDDATRECRFGDDVYAALRGIGFLYLLNHGIPSALVDSARREALELFSLPEEVKLRYHRFVRTSRNGYMPMSEEVLSNSETPNSNVTELKESWDMLVAGEDMPEAEAPRFSADVTQLMRLLDRLNQRVMAALEVSLGRPGLLTSSHRHQLDRHSGAMMRVVHYPPLPAAGTVPAGAVRCAAHSDWGSLTLLLQDHVGGLEVLSRASRWVSAHPRPDAVLVNVGDMMDVWTAGDIRATKHRVPLPADEQRRGAHRVSFVYFGMPDNEVMIEPPAGSSGYEPVNAEQYLVSKYSAAAANSHYGQD